jgi:nucleoside-diphosphate-sugar epimerase
VRVLVRRHAPELERLAEVQVVYGDLGDPEAVDRAVAGVRVVYHVGAATKGRAWSEYEGGTVTGTRNVVRACKKYRVERLVYVSSLAVLDYVGHGRGAIADERAPIEPYPERRGSYTRAKVEAEQLVLAAIDERGVPAVVVRPGQITGRGYQAVAPYGTIALAGRWIAVGRGRLKLPLVHVDDVVDGLLAAATRPNVCGSIFHLVDPALVLQRDYIEKCRRDMEVPVSVLYVPRTVLFAAAVALEAIGSLVRRTVPLTTYRIRSIRELTFDCSAARRQLGWTARGERSPERDVSPAASALCTRT